MSQINVNHLMSKFHEFERNHELFSQLVGGEPWWDSVRYQVFCFLFECRSGLNSSAASGTGRRSRRLGVLRRWILRQFLFAKSRISHRDLLVIRAPRSMVDGQLRDMVLDPIINVSPARTLIIDTLPRRYHLPDFNPAKWSGTVPSTLPGVIENLLREFEIDPNRATQLEVLIRRTRGQYEADVAGYYSLFDKVRPKAVILVQNGIEKSLFHVANRRNVPVVEAQHGLIGHGHAAYSYARDIEYEGCVDVPELFFTFSKFWMDNVFYPAKKYAVIGTDYFGSGFSHSSPTKGAVMIISANIYHSELVELTRQAALRLPDRKFIYKLHPNQSANTSAIRESLSDLPNVMVGDPNIPASQLIEEVSHVVAIQSTVVYEALQYGRHVSIVKRHNYHIHSDIFEREGVVTVDGAEELVLSLEMAQTLRASPVFFEKFYPERVAKLLNSLTSDYRNRSL